MPWATSVHGTASPFRCGCADTACATGKWQLQAFKRPAPQTTTTTAPSGGGGGSPNCVTSATNGHCQYGAVPYITGVNGNPYVDQNVWAGGGGYSQTLYATAPNDWYINVNVSRLG